MNRGSDWEVIRQKVLERDNHTCQRCYSINNLGVHHIIPWRKTNTNNINELITLCARCHITEENKYRKYGITNYTIKPK